MRVPPPRDPEAIKLPVPAVILSGWAPSIVVTLISPDVVFSEVAAAIMMGEPKLRLPLVVVIDPLKFTSPAPVSVKAPATEIAPGAVLVNVPAGERAKVNGPVPVVVIAAPRTIFVVVMEMPEAPVVVRAPLKVVVPVPADCKIEAAEIDDAVTLLAELMVNPALGTLLPTAPSK
jgi:hypothetical protein